MKLNKKEIESVSKLVPYKRYKYFIKKIADFEELWTLLDKDENIALSNIEDKTLVSFWTAKDFIESNLDDNWKGFKPPLPAGTAFGVVADVAVQEANAEDIMFSISGLRPRMKMSTKSPNIEFDPIFKQ